MKLARINVARVLPLLLGLLLIVLNGNSEAWGQTESAWGNLRGTIVLAGEVPEIPLEKVGDNKDRPVCLVDGKIPADDKLVVGEQGGLRDVFVILSVSGDEGDDLPIHSSYQKNAASKTATDKVLQLDNVKCRFVPHALFVRTNQKLTLKNSDAVGHNCKITSFNNEHNANLPPNGSVEIVLTKSDRVPANVSCEIHPWMDALILAKDHPYVAISAADGTFEIENLPAGDWQFQFWHQKVGYLKKLSVPDHQISRKGLIDVTIAADETLDLGTMKLPATAIKR